MACFSHFETAPFSFHLQRFSPKSSLTERSTYLVRISAPAPCGRNRGLISPGRVRSATPYFSDCPNQCAALYLVRILTAARCAGFRQAKSPGRVRSFRWKHCWSCFTTSLIRLRATNRGLTRARSIGRAFIPWMTRIWPLPGVRWRSCKPGLTSPLSWNASRWTASIRQRNITRSIWIETRTGIAMFRWG